MVMEVALLEAIELRIALQWLRASIGEVIAESVIQALGATYSCFTCGMIYLRAGGVMSSWSRWTSLPIDLTTTSAWSIEAV